MTRAAIQGRGPVYGKIHIGIDGQLWKWVKGYGQLTVATSGAKAVQYATDRKWPEDLIDLLSSELFSRVK